MSKKPSNITEALDDPASVMPRELKTAWINLAKYGVSERKLARLDCYLHGHEPIDAVTIDAASRVANVFPDSSHPSYYPLQNYIFSRLHARYLEAGAQEKDAIVILASSLFFQTHKKILNRRMLLIGENWESYIDTQYHQKVEIDPIKNVFDRYSYDGENVCALIAAAVKNAQLNFIQAVIGKKGHRRGFANPLSVDETYVDGAARHQFADARGSELDVMLQKEIDVANREAQQILNNPPAGLFSPRESEFLAHFMQAVNAGIEPNMPEIAATLGLASRTTAHNIKDRVFAKMQTYLIHGEKDATSGPPAHKGHLNNLQRLGRIKNAVLSAARLTPNEWKIIHAVTSMPEEQVSYEAVADMMGGPKQSVIHGYVSTIMSKIAAAELETRKTGECKPQPIRPNNSLQRLKLLTHDDFSGIPLSPKQQELMGAIKSTPHGNLTLPAVASAINVTKQTLSFHANAIMEKLKCRDAPGKQ